jgi:DNA-dependent RNA polymerase auxiliary subunit epsilon
LYSVHKREVKKDNRRRGRGLDKISSRAEALREEVEYQRAKEAAERERNNKKREDYSKARDEKNRQRREEKQQEELEKQASAELRQKEEERLNKERSKKRKLERAQYKKKQQEREEQKEQEREVARLERLKAPPTREERPVVIPPRRLRAEQEDESADESPVFLSDEQVSGPAQTYLEEVYTKADSPQMYQRAWRVGKQFYVAKVTTVVGFGGGYSASVFDNSGVSPRSFAEFSFSAAQAVSAKEAMSLVQQQVAATLAVGGEMAVVEEPAKHRAVSSYLDQLYTHVAAPREYLREAYRRAVDRSAGRSPDGRAYLQALYANAGLRSEVRGYLQAAYGRSGPSPKERALVRKAWQTGRSVEVQSYLQQVYLAVAQRVGGDKAAAQAYLEDVYVQAEQRAPQREYLHALYANAGVRSEVRGYLQAAYGRSGPSPKERALVRKAWQTGRSVEVQSYLTHIYARADRDVRARTLLTSSYLQMAYERAEENATAPRREYLHALYANAGVRSEVRGYLQAAYGRSGPSPKERALVRKAWQTGRSVEVQSYLQQVYLAVVQRSVQTNTSSPVVVEYLESVYAQAEHVYGKGANKAAQTYLEDAYVQAEQRGGTRDYLQDAYTRTERRGYLQEAYTRAEQHAVGRVYLDETYAQAVSTMGEGDQGVGEKRGQHEAATAIQSRHRGRAATKAVKEKRAQGGDERPVLSAAGDGEGDSAGDWSESDDGEKEKVDSSDDGEWSEEELPA